jgi:hypothetical protein
VRRKRRRERCGAGQGGMEGQATVTRPHKRHTPHRTTPHHTTPHHTTPHHTTSHLNCIVGESSRSDTGV